MQQGTAGQTNSAGSLSHRDLLFLFFVFDHTALSIGAVVPTCLAPETGFIDDNFSMELGRGRFRW